MSKRYSKLPSDLVNLKPSDYQFNMLVATVGIMGEMKLNEQALKRQKAAAQKSRR